MWELIEEQLETMCVLFSGLSEDAKANKPIRRLFGSIESSSGRRNALKHLAEVYFWPNDTDDKMKKKVSRLVRALSYASRRRDDIAHGVVANFIVGKSRSATFLIPARYNSERNKAFVVPTPMATPEGGFPFGILPGEYRYNSGDIMAITTKFHMLFQVVMEHVSEFIDWKTKVTSASPPPDET
jgi:hypothetical protein